MSIEHLTFNKQTGRKMKLGYTRAGSKIPPKEVGPNQTNHPITMDRKTKKIQVKIYRQYEMEHCNENGLVLINYFGDH